MKMLPLPKVDPSKMTRSQAYLEVIGPLLAIALIVIGLWVMPVGLFILCYLFLLVVGFWEVYAEHRAEKRFERERRERELRAPPDETPKYVSQDSFRSPATPRELHAELIQRSVKELHARQRGQFREKAGTNKSNSAHA
ncbi:MAG: hypothetical protein LV480_02760 [Methylacidiphilales bacterium]|nr:hypothetical protein [Candidatus Methylacidiphilales bacterium]